MANLKAIAMNGKVYLEQIVTSRIALWIYDNLMIIFKTGTILVPVGVESTQMDVAPAAIKDSLLIRSYTLKVDTEVDKHISEMSHDMTFYDLFLRSGYPEVPFPPTDYVKTAQNSMFNSCRTVRVASLCRWL